jgi:Flp pilus assembly secretin CpaC
MPAGKVVEVLKMKPNISAMRVRSLVGVLSLLTVLASWSAATSASTASSPMSLSGFAVNPVTPAPPESMALAQATVPTVLPPVPTAPPTPPTPLTAATAAVHPTAPYVGPASSSYIPPGSEAIRDPRMLMQGQLSHPRPQLYRNDPAAPTLSDSVTGGTHYLPEDVVELSAGSSSIYDFPRRIRRISIADTEVADLQVVNPFQINLVGHKEGFTTLAVWYAQGGYVERQVRIDPFGQQQVMLNCIVSEVNRSRMEEEGINWSFSLPRIGLSVLGLPNNLSTVNQGTAPGSAGQLIPLLLSTNVNYAVAAGNDNYQTIAFFQFLETHDLAKILAEPRLMANSGEKAEFLSGGEIPIVLAQALNTSIVFKEFGVSIVFVPTVVGSDDILLEVKPEVSQPNYAQGVSLFGFTVPAFITRRAQTFVRLKNNQMLIIAGLLLRTKTSHVSKTPYLGDIPYLGYLFKSTTYQDEDSDLVMAVTPQIVNPIPSTGQPALPTDRPEMTADEIRTQRIFPQDVTRPRF